MRSRSVDDTEQAIMDCVELQGRIAVVTGGASGIGAACCRLFAQEGARVVIFDRNADAASELAREIGSLATVQTTDVTDDDGVRNAMETCASHFGGIHILINNAGIAVRKTVAELDDSDWCKVIDVNLRGAFLCSKYALPHMARPGGSIVHMASVVGMTGLRNRAAYSASKGGLIALMRNMAMDYAPHGIRVNCVCPGFVRTPFTRGIFNDPDKKQRLTALHPLGRLGESEDIAQAVLFLASDRSSWITGQALAVDGGFTSGYGADV